MRTPHLGRLAAIALLAWSAAPLSAWAGQSTFDVTVAAGSCANCHGPGGQSNTLIPTLAGRPEAVLLSQLQAFKSDAPPPNTTIMNRLIKGFSDDELAALARHFSQITVKPNTGTEGR
ncbi:c-type cytochrome [Alcaligenes sp. SDU_A2]|uniref:c-type cytochrome n=1 Tax=Alcaligenes sp. SDU_A2 TaxID=3136634 RepID=UPI002CB04F04|nr:hypothetical protein [Alcaligenes sp.]HRL26644.1 hypothetical protein [Alcaligenes sp.]